MLQFEYDAATIDEHEIGEDVLNLLDLMRGDDDSAAAIEIIIEQRIVKLLAIQDVESERRFVEHQQSCVDSHDQREVELGHHALR